MKEMDYIPTSIVDPIKSNPIVVGVYMSNWRQVHNSSFDAGGSSRVLHFLKEEISQQKMPCKLGSCLYWYIINSNTDKW